MNEDTHDASICAPSLEQVQQRFESWRQRRKKRARIPQSLWRAAVALVDAYSIFHVSKALRVNYTDLKKRVVNAHATKSSDGSCPKFIELPSPALPVPESFIDMVKNDGSVMRMHVKGATCSDWVEIAKAFWATAS